MRPHKPKKAAGGMSRAKMLIRRDLAWIVGYPAPNGTWVSLPEEGEAEQITVDRTHLRRATYTINKLCREFPRALPRLVGDVDRWRTRHRALLELFKPTVHKGEALPGSVLDTHPEYRVADRRAAARLCKQCPSLSPVVSSLSWLAYLNPESLRLGLRWLRDHHGAANRLVDTLGEAAAGQVLVQLFRLWVRHGAGRVEPCLAWLADRRVHEVSAEQGRQFAFQFAAALSLQKKTAMPDRPEVRLVSETISWIAWLSVQDEPTARRSLELFPLVCDLSAIEAWEQWWLDLDRTAQKARELLPRVLRRRHPLARKLGVLRKRMTRMAEQTPPFIPSMRLFALLRQGATGDGATNHDAVCRALRVLPPVHDEAPLRLAFWFHWDALRRERESAQHNKIGQLIGALGEYVARASHVAVALRPWCAVWEGWQKGVCPTYATYTVDDDLLDDLPRKDQIRAFFSTLDLLNRDAEDADSALGGDDAELLATIVATLDEAVAVAAYKQLRELSLTDGYLQVRLLRLAAEIVGPRVENLGQVTGALVQANERFGNLEHLTRSLVRHWSVGDQGQEVLLQSILDGMMRALCEAARKAELVTNLGDEVVGPVLVFAPDETPAWIGRYPAALGQALQELAAVDPMAEAAARRILKADFPDPLRLNHEIAALRSRMARGEDEDGAMHKRVAKLRRRLSDPTGPGEQRLKNLSLKVRRAAVQARVKGWDKEMDAQLMQGLLAYLDVEQLPAWALGPDFMDALHSTSKLGASFQHLVRRVFSRRSCPPPWDFREQPANTAYVQRLEQAGMDMGPWVDGTDECHATLKGGGRVRFALERDPLEILRMGKHFGTCLSPGDINFFSVFANIADINKQVLYGKTSDGKVMARALLALTDAGGILTFHPYCHDGSLGFEKVLKRFANKLAEKMRTVVMPGGKVSTLVAADWYDDGPRDLVGQFVFARDGSSFRGQLVDLEPGDIVPAIEQAVAPLAINELTLPLIISLPELADSPAVLDALYPFVLRNERMEIGAVARYAELLLGAGRVSEVQRLVPRIVAGATQRAGGFHDHDHTYETMELLVKFAPSRALAVLRKTRPRQVRTWEQEYNCRRLCWGGEANRKLHRHKQAARLFALALQRNRGCEGHFCSVQLKELEQGDG